MTASWTARDLPSQHGRTVVITGANSGLGFVTAKRFATAGAHVVLAVRDPERGAKAAATLDGSSEVRPLDLADLASVRAFAESWDRPIDILVNNAGVMAVPHGRTADGFEMQIGTNHLGHFALTNLLLPQIGDRVVTISSFAHRMGRINAADLNWERRRYRRWLAYGQSKLANLLFTLELQHRLDAVDAQVRSMAAHPGYASTNLQSHTGSALQNSLMAFGNKFFAQSDEMGALPGLYAATSDLPGGSFVGPDGARENRGNPTLVGRSRRASDPELARRLWVLSEEMTGVTFEPAPASIE